MRPATRSAAQSYRQYSGNNNNNNHQHHQASEYASSHPEDLPIDYDGREAVRLQRFESAITTTATTATEHNGKSGPSKYYPAAPARTPQSIDTDLSGRIQLSSRQSPSDEDDMVVEETSAILPRFPNLRDGRVRIRPRVCSLVAFILAALSLAFLGLVAHSFLHLQRDPKGCKMSFMYPSYAKLNGFDTEHTRFATKYSLYLYREQKIDLSLEVKFLTAGKFG